MTFDEFLINSNKILYDAVKKAYESKQPLDMKVHELAMAHIVNQSFQLKDHITMPRPLSPPKEKTHYLEFSLKILLQAS